MNKNVEIASKVYFYAYVYPGKYNEYSVDKKISKKNKYENRVKKAIQEVRLEERGFLKIVRERRKGRSKNILYAKIDPLIDKINNKTQLEDFDRLVLRDKFDSKFFRYLLRNIESSLMKNLSSGIIEEILFLFEFLVIIFEDKKTFKQYSQGIETEEQYKKRKDEISQKIKSIIENRPDLKELSDQEKISLEVFMDMFVFFIFPKRVLDKIKKISAVGEFYFFVNELFTDISNFPEIPDIFNLNNLFTK